MFQRGQKALLNGREVVTVQDVGLTPGMVDVRRATGLVTRHSQDLLTPIAQRNPRVRRNASSSRRGKLEQRLQTTRTRIAELEADIAALELKKQDLEGKLSVARARLDDLAAQGQRGHDRKEAETAVGQLDSALARVVSFLREKSNTLNEARADLVGIEQNIRRLDLGVDEVEEDVEPRAERGRAPRWISSVSKPFGLKLPKPLEQVAPQKPIAEGGLRRRGIQTGRMAMQAGSGEQIEREGAVFLALPDPPRFPTEDDGQASNELCGNPLDGTAYTIFLSPKATTAFHPVTDEECRTILASWRAFNPGKTPPEGLSGLLSILRDHYRNLYSNYSQVVVRGEQWGDGSAEVQGFTEDQVHAIKSGVTPTPQLTRMRRSSTDLRPEEVARTTDKRREKELYKQTLPKNTFFYQQANGTYVAFTVQTRRSDMLDRLFRDLQPPWDRLSNKRRDPLFSWVRLDRPLSAGERAFYAPPLCVTPAQRDRLEFIREFSRPLNEMIGNLRWMKRSIEEYSEDHTRTAASICKAGDSTLRTLAWFVSNLQDLQQTAKLIPDDSPLAGNVSRLLSSVLKSKGNPYGLDADTLVKRATSPPVLLLVPNPAKKADLLNKNKLMVEYSRLTLKSIQEELTERENQRLSDLGAVLFAAAPPKYQGVPLQKEGGQADRLLKVMSRLAEKKKPAEAAQIERRIGLAVIPQLEDALHRALSGRMEQRKRKHLTGLQALGDVTPQPEDMLYLLQQAGVQITPTLKAQVESVFDAAAIAQLHQYQKELSKSSKESDWFTASKQANIKSAIAGVLPQVERTEALRGNLYIYNVLGGDSLLEQLELMRRVLNRVRDDAGQLPQRRIAPLFADLTQKQKELDRLQAEQNDILRGREHLNTIKDEIRLLQTAMRQAERPEEATRLQEELQSREEALRSYEAKLQGFGQIGKRISALHTEIKELQVRRKQMMKGEAIPLPGFKYYTYNPILAKMTIDWWNTKGTPWTKRRLKTGGEVLSDEARALLVDIDTAGRYGHSLRMTYEVGQVGSPEKLAGYDLRSGLAARLKQESFLEQIYPLAVDVSYYDDPTERLAAHKQAAGEGAKILASETYKDLELLEPGSGGTTSLFRAQRVADPDSPEGYRTEPAGLLVSLVEDRIPVEELTMASSYLPQNPPAYLSAMRRYAQNAVIQSGLKGVRALPIQATLNDIQMPAEIRRLLPAIGIYSVADLAKAPETTLALVMDEDYAAALKAEAKKVWLEGKTTRPKRPQAPKMGDVSAVQVEAQPPMQPFALTRPPYRREHPWTRLPQASYFPPSSTLAALEHLPPDAEALIKLINERQAALKRGR